MIFRAAGLNGTVEERSCVLVSILIFSTSLIVSMGISGGVSGSSWLFEKS